MSIIEQAARRLEELQRAGIAVPWEAAGLSEGEVAALVDKREAAAAAIHTLPDFGEGRVVSTSTSPPAEIPQTPRARGDRRHHSVSVDLSELTREGYLVPGQARSELMDEFRGIKRALLKAARTADETAGQRANLIMITSALPGEGKTFCAVNLALSMAMEIDTSVLLVDADVVRPSVLSRLGVPGPFNGLLDVLSDPSIDLDSAILDTNVDKLLVLPAGRQRFDSTELLASSAMETVLDRLARDHRDQVVIFDAPPLLVTTESKVLAMRVGQVVVVVDQGKTSPQDVAKTFAILADVPVVSSLLNKSRTPTEIDRYGYYEA